MRIPGFFTLFIILTSCDTFAQGSLIIDTSSYTIVTHDTSAAAKSISSSKMYKQDAAYDKKGELLNSVSHEQNDRKKKALVRIGIGIVFLAVVLGGWRRRKLAK